MHGPEACATSSRVLPFSTGTSALILDRWYLGVHRVKGVLGVDQRCCAALALHLCDRVHRQRRLPAALRTKHLGFTRRCRCQTQACDAAPLRRQRIACLVCRITRMCSPPRSDPWGSHLRGQCPMSWRRTRCSPCIGMDIDLTEWTLILINMQL